MLPRARNARVLNDQPRRSNPLRPNGDRQIRASAALGQMIVFAIASFSSSGSLGKGAHTNREHCKRES